MTSRAVPRLQLALAAALFSTGGAAIKACAMTSWQVAAFRSGIAAVALLLFLPRARRGFSLEVFGWSVAYAATLVLFVAANKLTTSANAIFLQSSAPLFVLLLAPLLLREAIRGSDWIACAVVAAGLALIFAAQEAPLATATDPLKGNLLAALSGLTFAIGIIGLRKMGRGARDASLAVVVLGNVLACLACLPKALPVAEARPTDWAILVFLGIIQIGVAYWLVSAGLRRVTAFEGSLLLLIEPALNPVWSFVVHGERPGTIALLGGALILAATLVKAWFDARREPAPA